MGIVFVEHDTPEPALYGAMAAIVAGQRGAPVMHLRADFATIKYPDAIQHVTADGSLVPSGLVWVERIAEYPVSNEATVTQVIERARQQDVIVPVALNVAAQRVECAALIAGASDAGLAVEHAEIGGDQSGYRLQSQTSQHGVWLQDQFGRFALNGWPSPTPLHHARIVLVGSERDHREIYPATLAAIGDAADAVGTSVEVQFVSPVGLTEKYAAEIAREANGIVLPGGSDMANVPGQIVIAHESIRRGTPTLGLCLGMQTMTTAAVQQTLGSSEVNLAEADPSAPIHTFVPLGTNATPVHRVGEQVIFPMPGSRLSTILGSVTSVRCNHRYKFNRELLAVLRRAGMNVAAYDTTKSIVEAVELSGHPFFIGMQGHPEIMSRQGAPHPLVTAFIKAAADS